MSSSTTSASVPSPTPTDNAGGGGGGNNGGGPTNSPLLFFVALGFGVVFTNLWIIVGVKYCFRYNQRNRAARAMGENGENIDLNNMPHPRRRRREKKLMSMEEVNERFPLTKYKIWRSSRESQGLPAEGGVTAPPSRAPSVKDGERNIGTTLQRTSTESARPQTAISIAQQDHANGITATSPTPALAGTSSSEKVPEVVVERRETAPTLDRNNSVLSDVEEEDDDDDDPIRTAAPPEMLAAPGDTCAICLDTLDDDDDVRGLTCGHAFHGSCMDPWLTSRRACCPLCKADYYISKPRADGDDTFAAPGGRGRNGAFPQHPPIAWIGGRGAALRPRMIFSPRHFVNDSNVREIYGSTTTQPSEAIDASHQESATQREQTSRSWRSRLPALPRLARRSQQQQISTQQTGHGPVEELSSGDLEAGVQHR